VTRYAAKVDKNQPEIVQAFRDRGCSVKHLHTVGGGVPDLLVGFAGYTRLVEVKTDKGKLTDAQKEWAEDWLGGIYLVRNLTDVENCVASMKDHCRWIAEGIRRDLLRGSEWLKTKC
jgi:hypothetical protein